MIGWEEIHRGRMKEAREAAGELMEVGRLLKDPRSTGLGLALLASIAIASDSYAEALGYCEQSLAVAVTPFDRNCALDCFVAAVVYIWQEQREFSFPKIHFAVFILQATLRMTSAAQISVPSITWALNRRGPP